MIVMVIRGFQMIAADAFKAFKEVEDDPEKLAAVGKRWVSSALHSVGTATLDHSERIREFCN